MESSALGRTTYRGKPNAKVRILNTLAEYHPLGLSIREIADATQTSLHTVQDAMKYLRNQQDPIGEQPHYLCSICNSKWGTQLAKDQSPETPDALYSRRVRGIMNLAEMTSKEFMGPDNTKRWLQMDSLLRQHMREFLEAGEPPPYA
jgi:hypothetical protein